MNPFKALWKDWIYYRYQQQYRMEPTPTETFSEYFNRQGFKNFHADELEWYFQVKRNGVHNDAPPRAIWKNIIPTVKVLQLLRDRLGRSIYISSSYRSKLYNSALSGAATGSYHMKFMACDIQVSGVSPRKVHAALADIREEGHFSGGLGLYSTFVHIDTRGYNANWKGSGV